MIKPDIAHHFTAVLLAYLIIGLGCNIDFHKDSEVTTHFSSEISSIPGNSIYEVEYAEGFRIREGSGYTFLEILNPYQNKIDTLKYILSSSQSSLSQELTESTAQVVNLPAERIVVTTTTQIGFLKALDKEDLISGVADPEYIYDESIRRRIDNQEILTFSGGNLNLEHILSLNPDLMLISGGLASRFDEYQMLINSGINVLVISEWLEESPLGRAEWIKVMGILTGSNEISGQIFNSVKNKYQELTRIVKNVEKRPTVINNLPYKGSWFVPGGDSYVVSLLQDAGSEYPWAKSSGSVTLQLDFESVYEKGLNAEVWLTPGTATSKNQIIHKDERLKEFKAFRENRIYNNTRRLNRFGGNDYWESGVVYPDRILADLIHIFHTERLPDRELYFYEKIH